MKDFQLMETTVAKVHQAMQEGRLTCRELVQAYLKRIEAYDQKGPAINSVIQVNPHALEEADALDKAFQERGFVGPLHGIPVMLKDNFNHRRLHCPQGVGAPQGCLCNQAHS